VHHEGRHVAVGAKRRGKAPEGWLARNNVVRFVAEIADGVAGGLADLDGGRAKVAATQVGQLAAHAADEVNPALDWADLGLDGVVVVVDWRAEVIRDEVAGGVVDVEAVRDAIAVEGEGRAIDDDGCEGCWSVKHVPRVYYAQRIC